MANYSNMQSNPLWDFIASMQDPRNNQFGAGGPPRGPSGPPPPGESFDPFQGQQWGGWTPFGPMPHRGRRHEHGGPRGRTPPPPEHDRDGQDEAGPAGSHPGHRRHNGPRGPHPRHGGPPPPPPPPPAHGGPEHEHTHPPPPPPPPAGPFDPADPPSRAPTPPTPPTPAAEPHGDGPRGCGPHGPGRRGGRFGGRGGHGPGHHRGGRGPHGFGGPHGPHGHGRGGPRGFGGPGAFPLDLNALIEAFAPGLFGEANNEAPRDAKDDGTFTPELDLFDTVEAYILHLSLPGAKKPDLSITYSSTRSSVTVSGVVTRPGINEEMMSTLALDERKVGAFEREVKLEEGVKIDEEGIVAKLEDGILRVIVPKLSQEEEDEYVDVKKIALD